MNREGLVIDPQTLWDQVERLARVHEPTYHRILQHVLGWAVVGADETRWRIMGKNGKPEGGSKWWQMWVAGCPDGVFYAVKDSRSADAAGELLGEYAGVVMCDGYTAYSSLQKRGARYELAHCWAHVRREFLGCESAFPDEAKEALDRIGKLYEVEASCPTGPPGDEELEPLRSRRHRGPEVSSGHSVVTRGATQAPTRGAAERRSAPRVTSRRRSPAPTRAASRRTHLATEVDVARGPNETFHAGVGRHIWLLRGRIPTLP